MEAIRYYVKGAFLGIAETPDVLEQQDELIADLTAKVADLVADGKTQDEALGIAIASMGDLSGLVREFAAEEEGAGSAGKSSLRKPLAVLLNAVMAITVLLAVIGAGVWWVLYKPAVSVAAGQPVWVEVPQGASTRQVAELLANEGVVSNALRFRLEAKSAQADRGLRAGVYELTTGMPDEFVISTLSSSGINDIFITIPEGWTIDQIAERVPPQLGIDQEEFATLAKTGAAAFAAEHPYLEGAHQGSLEGFLSRRRTDSNWGRRLTRSSRRCSTSSMPRCPRST